MLGLLKHAGIMLVLAASSLTRHSVGELTQGGSREGEREIARGVLKSWLDGIICFFFYY